MSSPEKYINYRERKRHQVAGDESSPVYLIETSASLAMEVSAATVPESYQGSMVGVVKDGLRRQLLSEFEQVWGLSQESLGKLYRASQICRTEERQMLMEVIAEVEKKRYA